MNSFTPTQKKLLMKIPIMKEIRKNYENSMEGGGKRKQKGRGFFDDVGSWLKQAGIDADTWLKKTGALSKLGSAVGMISMIPGLQEFIPVAAGIKGVASLTGYGHKRKKVFKGGAVYTKGQVHLHKLSGAGLNNIKSSNGMILI